MGATILQNGVEMFGGLMNGRNDDRPRFGGDRYCCYQGRYLAIGCRVTKRSGDGEIQDEYSRGDDRTDLFQERDATAR